MKKNFILLFIAVLMIFNSCSKEDVEDYSNNSRLSKIIYNYGQGYYQFSYNDDGTLQTIKWLDNDWEGDYYAYDFTYENNNIQIVEYVRRYNDGSVSSVDKEYHYAYNGQEMTITEINDKHSITGYFNNQGKLAKLDNSILLWNDDNAVKEEYDDQADYRHDTEFEYDESSNPFESVPDDALIFLLAFGDELLDAYFEFTVLSSNNAINIELTDYSFGRNQVKLERRLVYNYNNNRLPVDIIITEKWYYSDGNLEEEKNKYLEFLYE